MGCQLADLGLQSLCAEPRVSPSAVGESASYIVKNLLELGKNCTGVVTNCNVKSGRCRMINDCLEMVSEKLTQKGLDVL